MFLCVPLSLLDLKAGIFLSFYSLRGIVTKLFLSIPQMSTKTTKITITKSTVKVVNARDEKEFPKASKVDGCYVTPWETGEKQPPAGWNNFKYFFTPDNSKVPDEDVSAVQFFFVIPNTNFIHKMSPETSGFA